ncbi:mCG1049937 [Mus musculus]|nr:mCG1049937 [Mus musculus]
MQMPLSCKMVTLKVNMMKMAEYYIKYISKYISSCMKTFIL